MKQLELPLRTSYRVHAYRSTSNIYDVTLKAASPEEAGEEVARMIHGGRGPSDTKPGPEIEADIYDENDNFVATIVKTV